MAGIYAFSILFSRWWTQNDRCLDASIIQMLDGAGRYLEIITSTVMTIIIDYHLVHRLCFWICNHFFFANALVARLCSHHASNPLDHQTHWLSGLKATGILTCIYCFILYIMVYRTKYTYISKHAFSILMGINRSHKWWRMVKPRTPGNSKETAQVTKTGEGPSLAG